MKSGSLVFIFFNIFFFGLLSLFAAMFFFLINLKKKNAGLLKWLKQNGQIIEATVQSVSLETIFNYPSLKTAIKYNGRSPYSIYAQWVQPSANAVYVFKSEPLWIDPQEYIKPGDKIKVAIDPNNPKRYFVDTSFLPIIKS